MRKIIIARSAEEMRALRPVWDALYAQGDHTQFQSFAWNQIAAQFFAASETPCVVLAESDSGSAIIPACISKRQVSLLGETLFDYRDVLTVGDPDVLRLAWGALAQEARELPFSTLALRGDAAHSAAWHCFDIQPFADAPCIQPENLRTVSHPRLRRNMERLRDLGCELRLHNGDASDLLRAIYSLKAAQDPTSLFHDPRRVEVICAMAGVPEAHVEVHVLESGSELVAGLVTLIDSKLIGGSWRRFYTIYYNQRWAKYSPGVTLLNAVIEQSLAAGLSCDLMTGSQPYKLRLAHGTVPLYRVSGRLQQIAAASLEQSSVSNSLQSVA